MICILATIKVKEGKEDLFEKTFIDPLKSVIDATGWFINYDNSGTLDEFFG